jgi:hypothetical protein
MKAYCRQSTDRQTDTQGHCDTVPNSACKYRTVQTHPCDGLWLLQALLDGEVGVRIGGQKHIMLGGGLDHRSVQGSVTSAHYTYLTILCE